MENLEVGEFHHKGNHTFKRLDDGSVRIRKYKEYKDGKFEGIEFEHVVDRDLWCSVIACVSHRNETSEFWQDAVKFHG